MYRKLASLCLALALVLTLSPIVLADDWITTNRIGNPDAEIVLEWWVQADFSHRDHREARVEVYRDIYQQWAEDNPNVQVQLTIMPELEEFKNRLMLAASRGNPPDMSSVDSYWVPWFVDGGYLQPIDEFFEEDFVEDLFPFVTEGVSDHEGRVYALWHSTDMRALFYNTEIVPDPPRTWDELFEVGQQIIDEHGIHPYIYNGGRWEGTMFDNLALFWAQGGRLVDEHGAPIFNLDENREYMLNVLNFLNDTVETGISPPMVATFTNYQHFEPLVLSGDVAMFLGGSWQAVDLERILPPEEFEKWDVALIPQIRDDIASTGTGGWTWGIFTDDPVKKEAAYSFFAAQMTVENMGRLSQAIGNLPTRASVYEEVPHFSEDPFYAKYGEMLQYGQPRPGVPIYPTISEELQVAINTILTSDVSAERLLDEAWGNVMREYDR